MSDGNLTEREPVTDFPVKLTQEMSAEMREVILTMNDWAKQWQRWGVKVHEAVGHEEGAGDHERTEGAIKTRSTTHIVGDPPPPPFSE